jgi:hypothetical protein
MTTQTKRSPKGSLTTDRQNDTPTNSRKDAENPKGAACPHDQDARGLADLYRELDTSGAFKGEVDAAVCDALAQISGGTHSLEVFGDTMMRVHDAAVKVVGRDPLKVKSAALRSEHWDRIWEYVDRALHRLDDQLTRPRLH